MKNMIFENAHRHMLLISCFHCNCIKFRKTFVGMVMGNGKVLIQIVQFNKLAKSDKEFLSPRWGH